MSIKDAALTIHEALEKYGVDEFVVIATPDDVTFRIGKFDKMSSKKYSMVVLEVEDEVSVLKDLEELIVRVKRGWI